MQLPSTAIMNLPYKTTEYSPTSSSGEYKFHKTGRLFLLLSVIFCLLLGHVREAQAQHKTDLLGFIPVMLSLLIQDESEVSSEPIPETCHQAEVESVETFEYRDHVAIIDLDHLTGVSNKPLICGNENVDNCVERLIKQALPLGCRTEIDIIIGGTNQEDGNPKQFAALVFPGDNDLGLESDNRGTISIGYSPASPLDTINYDRGVRKSRDILGVVLRVLKERIQPESVRVYGHSKGSHGVALAADRVLGVDGFENYHFFAFGQAARTTIKIDDTPDMKPSKMGAAGYIQKLTNNMVGITWENDEVRDYTGDGFNGLKPSLSIRYPGKIIGGAGLGSGVPLYTRFDHHNTYGGGYTESSVPYCYTGSGFIIGLNSSHPCVKKVQVTYPAFFWGNADCRAKSWAMLEDENAPDKIWIGTSGPRVSSTNCAPKESTVSASYSFGYRHNQADKDCHLKMSVKAFGLNSPGGDDRRPNGSSFSVSQDGDLALVGSAKRKTGSITLPYNMTLQVEAYLLRESGIGNCISVAETETYIDYLRVTFKHPVTNKSVTKYLIGNAEIAAYPGLVAQGQLKSPWKRTSGKWDLKYDVIYSALKIEGDTYAESERSPSLVSLIRLTKTIHLID